MDAILEILIGSKWIRFFLLVGFPVLVAFFFMAKDVGWIPSPMTAMAAEIREHMANDPENTYLMRLICQYSAHTNIERNACLAAPRKDRDE